MGNNEAKGLEATFKKLEALGEKVQFRGDQGNRPVWWPVADTALWSASAPENQQKETYQAILDGLDRKRVVRGKIGCAGDSLECSVIRILHADTPER